MDNGAPAQTPLSRIIKNGCSVRHISNAVTSSSLGALAGWLEKQSRSKDGARVRMIESAANDRFKEIEEGVATYTVKKVSLIGKGSEWDPDTMIASALQILGGEAVVTQIVASARDVRLAAFKAPAAALFRQQLIDPSKWAEDEPSMGLSEIKGNSQLYGVRTSMRLPLTFYRYLIEGKPYGNAIAQPRPGMPLYASPIAEAAYDEALSHAAKDVLGASRLPFKDAFAALLTEKFNEAKSPSDNAERAMAYVAALPNICLSTFLEIAPGYLGQDVVEGRYIPNLKEAGKW